LPVPLRIAPALTIASVDYLDRELEGGQSLWYFCNIRRRYCTI
jgi:hypothetical protein